MMITLDMFEDTPAFKLARKDDPQSSKDAANEVSSGKMLTLVYKEIVKAERAWGYHKRNTEDVPLFTL